MSRTSMEPPAERLRRRLGADRDGDAMDATDTEDTDEQPDTSLSRWLPESTSTGPAGWISTIRADPGRAGVVALGVIGAVGGSGGE